MTRTLDMNEFVCALAAAREAGDYYADMSIGGSAEAAWWVWFDRQSDAWRACLNDMTEEAIRSTFVLSWSLFKARSEAFESTAANSNAEPLRRAQ